MNCKIIMVTGGQRSGKSEFAEKLALQMSASPVYVATSEVPDDEEFRRRVELHRRRRGSNWTTIEEPMSIGKAIPEGRVVLVDCVTLWATNVLLSCGEDVGKALEFMLAQMESICQKESTIIFVTNEIGLGGVSANALSRRFADLQGLMNQEIASLSQEVYFVVSGIPVKIKNQL